MRPPAPPEHGDELAQLQGLLTLCTDLSKEVAKPDTEWVRELLQQLRTELERQEQHSSSLAAANHGHKGVDGANRTPRNTRGARCEACAPTQRGGLLRRRRRI